MMAELVWDPALPRVVVIGLGALLVALNAALYARFFSRLRWWQNGLLLGMRLLGVMLVVGLLLQPSRLEEIRGTAVDRTTLVAVDNSRSMAQRDVAEGNRLAAANRLLIEAGVVTVKGEPRDASVRLFKFDTSAEPMADTGQLDATGETTRFHSSIRAMLSALPAQETAQALILLSDGHDFEWVNPGNTGFLARARQTPIYAVAVGKQGKVRDRSLRITGGQPYCYAKQKARISAAVRVQGEDREPVTVRLLREGKVVQSQELRVGLGAEGLVNFEVLEPAAGQYEYELEVLPMAGEMDLANNRAATVLEVIDQQIQVLLLEGEPYWDTSFLQRSLSRNEKLNVDSIVQYAAGKARVIRKDNRGPELNVPVTRQQWGRYDVVILGRSVEKLISVEGLIGLESYVSEDGGMVILSRAGAFGGELRGSRLEPVSWGELQREAGAEPVAARLEPAREGASLAPFRLWAGQGGAAQSAGAGGGLTALQVPKERLAMHRVLELKPLAATLAVAQADGEQGAAMVYRRFGQGQVLSVGVDGLWRWAFNARVDRLESQSSFFDRFWDQMVLWLLAGRDIGPTQNALLRVSALNVPLGEKVFVRAALRQWRPSAVAFTVERDGAVVKRGVLEPLTAAGESAAADDGGAPAVAKFAAEFLPEKAGRYRVQIEWGAGSRQSTRFIVFEDNLEQTEVATDTVYLRRLCESSGGRLLEPAELAPFLTEMRDAAKDATVQTRLVPVWDRLGLFWMLGFLFGSDWFLRRRWGLW